MITLSETDEDDDNYAPSGSGASSVDGSDALQAAADASAEGGGQGDLLDRLHQEIGGIVEQGADETITVEDISEALHQKKREFVLLQQMLQPFSGNTAGGVLVQMRDWSTFCEIVYGCDVVEASSLVWPPPLEEWLSFLNTARPRVSSYQRFKNLVVNDSTVGSRIYSSHTKSYSATLSPRKLYGSRHTGAMQKMSREYGCATKQVEAIDMAEARGGPFFCDKESILEVFQACAWNTGVKLGGRRPRALTCWVEDLKFRAASVCVDGVDILVPEIQITYPFEKVDDPQGSRSIPETVFPNDYDIWKENFAGYWFYKLFVMRNLFQEHDPLTNPNVRVGDLLKVKVSAAKYYLFCECGPDWWYDNVPISVHTLGHYTKAVLRRMGRPERGFSAHRSGFVTRSCILNFLRNKGMSLAVEDCNALVRMGGWTTITGVQTIFRVYIRKVMDDHFNADGIVWAREAPPDFWPKRFAEFQNRIITPGSPGTLPLSCPRNRCAFGFRLAVWRSDEWTSYIQKVNANAKWVMAEGRKDFEVMPMNRWHEERALYNRALKAFALAPQTVELYTLMGAHVQTFQACAEKTLLKLGQEVGGELLGSIGNI